MSFLLSKHTSTRCDTIGFNNFPEISMLQPSVCRYEHFLSEWYARQCEVLGFDTVFCEKGPASYRKIWEWAAILQALSERGLLAPDKRGLGFAV